ncbi:helicase-related protein [Corynebacterium alimapuense]|uniref:Helicase n=1 Tax=Corynebacterium alimapuense TaxID=1576874 RepID=A0A3M8K7E5_9CORY|nr:helicase-related protein [Corynebacterium alimapuense]RNE48434.1 helicase [Corynebacterium alimapuense]
MSRDLESWYKARKDVISFVTQELMGPDGELLDSAPLNRIIVGVLFPQEDQNDSKNPDGTDASISLVPELKQSGINTDEQPEQDVSMSNQSLPSSMGLTFSLPSRNHCDKVLVYPSAVQYEFSSDETHWTPKRVSPSEPISIPIDEQIDTLDVKRHTVEGSDGKLELISVVRPPFGDRVRITVTLVNLNKKSEFKGKKDAFSWFRPKLRVVSPSLPFVDNRGNSDVFAEDTDSVSTAFLYRAQANIAQGHGCAATWEDSISGVFEIQSTYIPEQSVPLSSAAAGTEGDPFGEYDLNMGKVARPSGREELHGLADSYEKWIEEQYLDLDTEDDLSDQFLKEGRKNLIHATECLERIRSGIDSLDDSSMSQAFELMNLAMIQQRDAQDTARASNGSKIRMDPENLYITKQAWRPFQMAFILMNLPALGDRRHPERHLADLLWFPTGGGKTEAYLGCIAFSILYRRILDPKAGGVSAIMRYTLRILTTDQFTRAAGLICALEIIRRRHLPNTELEISLGLWVGDSTVPNRISLAKIELKKLKSGSKHDRDSNLIQVKRCPNCSYSLSSENYYIEDSSGLSICCPNIYCEFHDSLPLYIIDDDLYEKRPSLIIGTVDKFAQMTWRSEVSHLLGTDGKHPTPDLIVQDELHLISGPLGTMVGLYESALDLALYKASGSKVKVIASTATIRRADEQVLSVFDRKAAQFPPAGISPSDNYFSKEASPDEMGDRKYVGVVAPGTSQATLLVRLYAAVLQAAESIQTTDEVRDAYWTLLGYFNSLRVLGSTYLQVIDDIPDRVTVIANRRGEKPRQSSGNEPLELTSRRSAAEILSMREQMEVSITGPTPANSPDVVLATNMISVGLDIDRLGLMVVAGQPQNTSEYIQATSRVGRKHPGLIFVAFNAQRSRDVSHFEAFVPFHRSLYRSVEATTATPFSARARDRGAHGVLVAATRMAIDEMRASNAAGEAHVFKNEIYNRVIVPLVDRSSRVSEPDSKPFMARLIKLLDTWEASSERDEISEYGQMYIKPGGSPDGWLIRPSGSSTNPGRFNAVEFPMETLTSLRDVDAETKLTIYKPRSRK